VQKPVCGLPDRVCEFDHAIVQQEAAREELLTGGHLMQREQIAAEPLRGRTDTSILLWPGLIGRDDKQIPGNDDSGLV
jgi:hypothetical protein